jgi:hypothetical protein
VLYPVQLGQPPVIHPYFSVTYRLQITSFYWIQPLHSILKYIFVAERPLCVCSMPDVITSLMHCAVTSHLCSCCQQSCARLPVWHGSRNLPRVLPSILVLRGTAAGQTVLVTPGAWLHTTLSSGLQGHPYRRSAPRPTVDSFSGQSVQDMSAWGLVIVTHKHTCSLTLARTRTHWAWWSHKPIFPQSKAKFINSFSSLSDDRSKASSKTVPPHSAN